MDFISVKEIIFDHNLIMAIIAINMTIIGLTSLAETKNIIGVDYGKFLIKKYRVLNRFRIYHLLIVFAIINVSSLFLMFVKIESFRMFNFLLLIVSLTFAIYYFFAYIISENKWVKKQIYEDELYGMYFESDNRKHLEVDMLAGMNSGSRTSKRFSGNVINYFNIYNSYSQIAFEEIFGPNSLLYDYSKKAKRKLRKNYNIAPYIYRNVRENIYDISYEYFQMFRYSDMQDKWTIEILSLFDGDRNKSKKYNQIRMSNFTRVVTHLNLFGNNESIYKYKFLEYLIPFYYNAVQITPAEINDHNLQKIKETEVYTYNQLLHFMFSNEKMKRDVIFERKAAQIMHEIILKEKYKGVLEDEELIEIFLEKVLSINTQELKQLFTEVLQAYYSEMESKQIHPSLHIDKIKESIKNYQLEREQGENITVEMVFGGE